LQRLVVKTDWELDLIYSALAGAVSPAAFALLFASDCAMSLASVVLVVVVALVVVEAAGDVATVVAGMVTVVVVAGAVVAAALPVGPETGASMTLPSNVSTWLGRSGTDLPSALTTDPVGRIRVPFSSLISFVSFSVTPFRVTMISDPDRVIPS
jgi:hypothetical protein